MTDGGPPITREDVWSLLAVAYVDGAGLGTDLRFVSVLSGAIRHAPLDDEPTLRASLDRLRDAGLVVESDGLHRPTRAVAAFLRARSHRRGVWHDYRDLIRHLGLEDR